MIVATIILIVLSAICKAVYDKIANQGDNSVFFRMGEFWWRRDVGHFLPFTKYRWNAWHIAGSLMICFFLAAICINLPYSWLIRGGAFVGSGILFTVMFNLFYNKIFK